MSHLYLKEIPYTIRRTYTPVTVANFSEVECKHKFGFLKHNIPILLDLLKLQSKSFKLRNKSTISGEELLLFSFARFRTKCKYSELSTIFGRDYSILSNAFIIFVDYIIANFMKLVTEALPF